jgi:hypothetical protein
MLYPWELVDINNFLLLIESLLSLPHTFSVKLQVSAMLILQADMDAYYQLV